MSKNERNNIDSPAFQEIGSDKCLEGGALDRLICGWNPATAYPRIAFEHRADRGRSIGSRTFRRSLLGATSRRPDMLKFFNINNSWIFSEHDNTSYTSDVIVKFFLYPICGVLLSSEIL